MCIGISNGNISLSLSQKDSEREKFRAYVEKSGLMSTLTNVLVILYKEPNKPKDALSYVMESLGTQRCDVKKMELLLF
ncbi:hypothetical protein Avbf_01919 [Armadillidium vulgare]|nr:hypothetical protein Avbf_01919 [Armadillidium vulgare]